MHQEQRLTATEEQQHNKEKLKQAKIKPHKTTSKKIKPCAARSLRGKESLLVLKWLQQTAHPQKTSYFHRAKNTVNAGTSVCWTPDSRHNVPAFTPELSGLVCGQEVDNDKWIRRETSPKGRFIQVCVCLCVCVMFSLWTWPTLRPRWGAPGAAGSLTG